MDYIDETTMSQQRPLIDLRLIFEIIANIVSIMGLALNALLIYLIFYKTTKLLDDYKIILLQNCLIDIFFTVVNDITKVQTDYKNGSFFMLIVGKFSFIPFPYNYLCIVIWVFALLFCVTSIPVQFIYRYFMIVREKKLTNFQYFIIFGFSIIGAFSYACITSYVFWPNPTTMEEKLALLKADPYFFNGIPPFFVADIFHWPLRISFCYASFLISISYGITIVTCIKVWRKLNQQHTTFSFQTQKIHKQMTKTIIFQAIIPLIFVMCPVGSVVVATFAQINIPGLGVIVSIYWCWIPVTNPLVTIFSIKCYRRAVIGKIKKVYSIAEKHCKKIIKPNIYSINSLQSNAVVRPSNNIDNTLN